MSPPSKEMKVVINDLRSEAKVWDDQSEAIGKAAAMADGLSMSRVEAGVFQLIYGEYHSVLEQVVARSNEGVAEMASIADALRKVAKGIEEDEASNEQQMRNLKEGLAG